MVIIFIVLASFIRLFLGNIFYIPSFPLSI